MRWKTSSTSTSILDDSLNFSYGALDEDQVRIAFEPQDYRRLTEFKAEYDPHGLLHCNHPIPPLARRS
ncbi:MAG: hypothetical protein ACRDRL_02405 [Sciscionella sp.]